MKHGMMKRSLSLLLALLMTVGLMTPAFADGPEGGDVGNEGTTYTITFNATGGSPTPESMTTGTDGKLTSLPSDPTRDGYTFDGWYYNNAKVSTETVFTANAEVTAQWTQIPVTTYTITFNAGDGVTSPASQTTDENGKLSSLPSVAKDGYTFDGWYNGSDLVTLDTKFSSDTTVTAKWTSTGSNYTITFDVKGGTFATGSFSPMITDSSGKLAGFPAVTRDGYTFNGWYTAATGGDKREASFTFTQDTTLYAQWTKNAARTITLNPNWTGGTVSPTTVSADANGKVLETLPTPTRSGYAFQGWYTAASGGTKITTGGTVPSGVTTLYAQWTTICTVTFNLNATSGAYLSSGSSTMNTDINGKITSILPVATRSGYSFQGWWTTSGASGGTQVLQNSTVFYGNTTVYARWVSTNSNLTATLRSDLGVTLGENNTITEGTSILAKFTSLAASYGKTLNYVIFGAQSNTTYGALYTSANALNRVGTNATYYNNNSSTNSLSNLYFLPTGIAGTWSISYDAYDTSNKRIVSGTLSLTVPGTSAGSVTYTTNNSTPVVFNPEDFNNLLQTLYPRSTLTYVQFNSFSTGDGFDNARGYIYYNYGASGQTSFSSSSIRSYKFYYSDSRQGQYPLSALTFVPGTNLNDYTITLNFTAYGSSSASVTGTLVLNVTSNSGVTGADIVYATTSNKLVPIRVSDLTRFFTESYGSDELNYVVLRGVPSSGTLYYNYNGTESYGSSKQVKITASNYSSYKFYVDPTSTKDYLLSGLTYVPSGSNYCVTIPFTAYGDKTSRSAKGSILISVTNSTVSEVYSLTTINSQVNLDAAGIYNAVQSATGQNLSYIQFTDLPSANRGTLYYTGTGSSTQRKVSTEDTFKYSGSGTNMSSLYFTPKGTGSINLPYVAFTSSGKAIAYGNVAIGVVSRIVSYNDVGASRWYYKYVVELSDAGVINGMPDGNYAGQRDVTYGEALKLIMLAAGRCTEQTKQAGKHWAAGYMEIAQRLGILAGDVDLDAPISRQAVATLAANAMRLSSYPGSSPFADTSNSSVLKLYEAGIVEGSEGANGAMYFYPNNTLTRAEVATIIWRIYNAS